MVHILHGDLLGLLADFAVERPLRHQSREGAAHLDSHEVYFLYREARMLLDRGPSWRQGTRPQPVDPPQDQLYTKRVQLRLRVKSGGRSAHCVTSDSGVLADI